jgi:signal transduction histidine kinase
VIRLGARINFAFIAVILVMVLTQAGFSFFVDFKNSRDRARAVVDPALKMASTEIMTVYNQNLALAQQIAADPAFEKAYAARDRNGVAQSIKAAFDRTGFAGYGTIVLDNGKVFYSSDSPAKFGYPIQEINNSFGSRVLDGSSRMPNYALCCLTITPTYTLSSAVPLKQGMLAIGTPFAEELLHGMERKIKITNEALKDFNMVFHVLLGKGVTASSSELFNAKPSYLINLNRGTEKVQEGEKEADGRLWKFLPIRGPDGQRAMGQVIVCAPLQNPYGNPAIVLSLVLSAAAAYALSCLFTAGLSGRFSQSIRFLKQRAKDLASNRHDLPSLSVLNGDWLELAEMMDTAMASPRTVVLNLKQNVAKQEEELQEKQRQVDSINYQLEQVNKQLTAHNRQALEVNAQVQNANRQAVQIQQRLEAVLQCTSEGFLLLDPYGSVLAANPRFLTWIGVPERDIAGRICFDLVRKPGDSGESQGATFANPGSSPEDLINQFYPEGVIYNRAQGKQVEVLMHLQPVVNEGGIIEGYLMVLRDKALHAEVARLRKEIVTMLSDDVRTPLVSAESHWQALMGAQLQNLSPQVSQHLIEMQKVYEQMLGVVESYLMMYGGFVPVPAEHLQREEVSVTRLIGECLETVSQRAREQQIMLDYKTVTGLPTTAINKEIVRDIILQLLEKMISVTAPGGRVRAETTVKGQEIRLIISSSGPALQQVEIEEMFIGFVDGRHDEETYQSRLLMYLARNNAERLGGRIWAESEAGRGTAIFLTLPVH